MPEILIFAHGNRFLINKFKIKFLTKKNRRDPDLLSVSLLQSCCGCCYKIKYNIYNNFFVFCKSFNLETENIFKKINVCHHGVLWVKEKNVSNI